MAETIAVKFFGLLRRRIPEASLEIAAGPQTVLALLRRAEAQAGRTFLDELLDPAQGLLTGTIVLINGENIRLRQGLETMVGPGDRVELFSPAGGG